MYFQNYHCTWFFIIKPAPPKSIHILSVMINIVIFTFVISLVLPLLPPPPHTQMLSFSPPALIYFQVCDFDSILRMPFVDRDIWNGVPYHLTFYLDN